MYNKISNRILNKSGKNLDKDINFIIGKINYRKINLETHKRIIIGLAGSGKSTVKKVLFKNSIEEKTIFLNEDEKITKYEDVLFLLPNDLNKDLGYYLAKHLEKIGVTSILFIGKPTKESLINFYYYSSIVCYGYWHNNNIEEINFKEKPVEKKLEEKIKKDEFNLDTLLEMFNTILKIENTGNLQIDKMITQLKPQYVSFKKYISIIEKLTEDEKITQILSQPRKREIADSLKGINVKDIDDLFKMFKSLKTNMSSGFMKEMMQKVMKEK